MSDFILSDIEIRYHSNSWGPHLFHFDGGLPLGTEIDACTLRSFLGEINPGDDLDDYVETTSELVDTNSISIFSGDTIRTFFNYPATAAYRSKTGVAHTLVFEIALASGATHPFYFHSVVVYGA